ncbi:NUDIX domain-containing protein [Leifsonia sp. F6_8S_P_1B]|uniref:NUDIX domain-containing protein n=1 Tax=Leifsonia williamsii TaxID=3035919 RepID=A0ABT8KGZ9_9MICO|nr:NUDIX domain-containing protein [Leifsonia williamsii]MDN4615752.1 NUDIX domain-containing protein [Leifsonia williamsii]
MTTKHERASALLAVSTVIFALRKDDETGGEPQVWLPLVRRIREPFQGRWALPGGPLRVGEDLAYAAGRTLNETTGLAPSYLEQLYAFGDASRSSGAERVVSIVYWALVRGEEAERAVVGENVAWFPADHLPELAFDHNLIVEYALWRLRTKMEYSRIAHAFLGERFTLAQLREVHEAVLGRALDPANFRRTIEASGAVVATDEYLTGTPHRPPRLYRYDDAVDLADAGPLPLQQHFFKGES